MRAETITWGDLILRKEAIIGINKSVNRFDVDQGVTTINLFLIGGQTISIPSTVSGLDADYNRIKGLAGL